MIAGEYAVLEPNQQLIVTAVNRFIYVTVNSSRENLLTVENFELTNLKWKYQDNKIKADVEDGRTSFVRAAMEVTLTYLLEQSIHVEPISINIKSELDDENSGLKYGLGSSAAVVTGVVSAILTKFSRTKPSNDVVFKLAAIAHVKTQGSGSGADIAASTYGGVLHYSSFQANWLLDKLELNHSISNLIESNWEFLYVEQIDFPKNWHMIVGWTGTPASTAKLVDKILKLNSNESDQFQQFLTNSSQAVKTIIQGIVNRNVELFYQGIKQNRNCLATIGKQAKVNIETPLLKELSDIATNYGGAGKLSGAGGGDCGIAFSTSADQIERIKRAWSSAGIKPLQIKQYPCGVTKLR